MEGERIPRGDVIELVYPSDSFTLGTRICMGARRTDGRQLFLMSRIIRQYSRHGNAGFILNVKGHRSNGFAGRFARFGADGSRDTVACTPSSGFIRCLVASGWSTRAGLKITDAG